jgi:CDP-paratose 2-epimerase
LTDLIEDQLVRPERWDGRTVNVGGGRDFSLSLRATIELCAEITRQPAQGGPVERVPARDVRIYLSDCLRLQGLSDWRAAPRPRGHLRLGP